MLLRNKKEQFSTFRELFVLLWAWHDEKFAADDRLSFVWLANFPPREETEVLRRELVCISIGVDNDRLFITSNIIVRCWQLHANLIQNIQNSRSTRSEHVALTYYLNNLLMNEWINSFTITLCAWNSRAVIMYETCSSNVIMNISDKFPPLCAIHSDNNSIQHIIAHRTNGASILW